MTKLITLILALTLWGGIAFGSDGPVPDVSAVAQTSDATLQAASTGLRIMGYTVRESEATPALAAVALRHDADGTCNSTEVFAFVALLASTSQTVWFGDKGLDASLGVCADITDGTVDIGIFLNTR